MNLIQFLAMKLHQGPMFIDGMVNSSEVVVHSKTNPVEGCPKSVAVPETIADIAKCKTCDLSRDGDNLRH